VNTVFLIVNHFMPQCRVLDSLSCHCCANRNLIVCQISYDSKAVSRNICSMLVKLDPGTAAAADKLSSRVKSIS